MALNLLVQFREHIQHLRCGYFPGTNLDARDRPIYHGEKQLGMVIQRGLIGVWHAIRSWLPARSAMLPAATGKTMGPVTQVIAALQPGPQQWSKISAVLDGGAGSAALAQQLQRSAGQQLDAASYALDILKFELTAAMHFGGLPAKPSTVVLLARPLRTPRQKQPIAA